MLAEQLSPRLLSILNELWRRNATRSCDYSVFWASRPAGGRPFMNVPVPKRYTPQRTVDNNKNVRTHRWKFQRYFVFPPPQIALKLNVQRCSALTPNKREEFAYQSEYTGIPQILRYWFPHVWQVRIGSKLVIRSLSCFKSSRLPEPHETFKPLANNTKQIWKP